MIILFFFILGLAVGSFLNVVVLRLQNGETILGRSFCHSCNTPIPFYDNIPILSYVLLRGRCRYCQQKLSVLYPVGELVSGIVFACMGIALFPPEDQHAWIRMVWLLVMVSIFIAIAIYDMMYMEIPVVLLMAGLSVSLLYACIRAWFASGDLLSRVMSSEYLFLGALVVGSFFFALVYVSHETWMGWGDVWLGALAGFVVGLPAILGMLTLAFGIGAIHGIILLLIKQKQMRSQIPFGPYLVVGTFVTVFLLEMAPDYVRLMLW